MKETFYKLSQTEMLSVIAGDMLPEVVVYSSYSRVFGMNYSAWLLTNQNLFQNHTVSPQGKSFGDTYSGSGGGSSLGSGISDALRNDLLNLSDALNLSSSTLELTTESVQQFFNHPANRALFSRIGNALGGVGVITGAISVYNTLVAKNWTFSALTTEERIDVIMLIAGIGSLAIGLFFAGSLGIAGFTLVAAQWGWGIYRSATGN